MSRDIDVQLAEWAGYTEIVESTDGNRIKGVNPATHEYNQLPFYTTIDSDASKLLPVFVERGYEVELQGRSTGFCLRYRIEKPNLNDWEWKYADREPTIHEAIYFAVLAIINE